MAYHIAQFEDGTMVVCDSWVQADVKVCYLPTSNIRTAVKKGLAPDVQNWVQSKYEELLMSHGKALFSLNATMTKTCILFDSLNQN